MLVYNIMERDVNGNGKVSGKVEAQSDKTVAANARTDSSGELQSALDSLRHITTYQAGVAQAAAHRTLQKYCDNILKPYGITKMQWLIIGTVLDAGATGVRISNLAATLGTTMPYMTTSVNMLELKGMLDRSDNKQDSRSKLVTVTDSFASQCETIERTLRDGLRKTIYADIDPIEFRIYMKVLFELRSIPVK